LNNKNKTGKLFIVSTPIGNKDDISLRALSALKVCDFVICEEIKEGARLLKNVNLEKELVPLNEQNEIEQTFNLLERLERGSRACLVSDCGTPLLADPGLHLLKAVLKTNIEIEVIPGASSILTALVRSGFDASSFFFAGMLSRKEEERLHELKSLSHFPRTVILLETPYRLKPLLEAAAKIMPDRNAYIGMNLTMMYETHHYGTFEQLYEKFKNENIKAEFVICFEGFKSNTFSQAADRMFRSAERPYHKSKRDYQRSSDKYNNRGGKREDYRKGSNRSEQGESSDRSDRRNRSNRTERSDLIDYRKRENRSNRERSDKFYKSRKKSNK